MSDTPAVPPSPPVAPSVPAPPTVPPTVPPPSRKVAVATQRVQWSVGTKLIGGVVSLILLIIFVLDLSAILIMREEKRTSTYQLQSAESQLTGRQFVVKSRQAIDTLKVALATIDLSPQSATEESRKLTSLLKNQTALVGIRVGTLSSDGSFRTLAQSEQSISPAPLEPNASQLSALYRDLKLKGYAFSNLSVAGQPMLGVAFADQSRTAGTSAGGSGASVAYGWVALNDLITEDHGTRLSILGKSGDILFDTDAAAYFGREKMDQHAMFKLASQTPVSSGAQEFSQDDQHYLGSYFKPGLDLTVISIMEWKRAMQAAYTLTEKFLYLGFMAISFAVALTVWFSRTLTAPLETLFVATRRVGSGDFDIQVEAESHDEIGQLAESFTQMSKQIRELIVDREQKVRIENELKVASLVQQTLFPPTSVHSERYTISSHYQSASECGGDWWGYFENNNRLTVLIGDATGHGIPSALITAAARSCFSVIHKIIEDQPEFGISPSHLLQVANRAIYESAQGKIMMTFFCGVIDLNTLEMTFASAGHNPMWLLKNPSFGVKSLMASGMRLGESTDATAFQENRVQLESQDILFLYTDGLLEGTNTSGAQYGKKQARKMVEQAGASGPEAVIKKPLNDFMAHNGTKPLDDDVTLVAIQFKTTGGPNA